MVFCEMPAEKFRNGVRMAKDLDSSKYLKISYICVLLTLTGFVVSGCSDPTAIGRFKATPVTNIILDDLGVVDEKPPQFSGARDPKPEDLLVDNQEYLVRAGDVIDVGIMDLYEKGIEWRNRLQVSETGRVTVPEIGTFQVTGRTELELTEDIKNMLSPHVLKDPTVSVVVVASTEKVFSISGAIAAPGRYPLPEPDFRIYEALSSAGGVRQQTGVDYIYVLRTVSEDEIEALLEDQMSGRGMDMKAVEPEAGLPPIPTPPSEEPAYERPGRRPRWDEPVRREETGRETKDDRPAQTSDRSEPEAEPEEVTPQQEKEELLESISPLMIVADSADGRGMVVRRVSYAGHGDSEEMLLAGGAMLTASDENGKPFKAVREGSRFKLVPTEDYVEPDFEQPQEPAAKDRPETGKEWDSAGWRIGSGGQMQEVIRVDLKALQRGDLTQNIVIRAGDHIMVQLNEEGIYYVWGQVGRPGPYVIQGEKLTLKEVIAAAGALTPFASPERCDITRRISRNKEVTCRINLKKLLEGSQPNIYIKPHDIINVGSHPTARWLAVIRQSFRATYGFGFVYDRNLADKDIGN